MREGWGGGLSAIAPLCMLQIVTHADTDQAEVCVEAKRVLRGRTEGRTLHDITVL